MLSADLARVYADHAASVFAFARSLMRCECGAKDILQEVFAKLARQGALGAIQDVRAYVLRMAHNAVINWYRSEGTRNRLAARLGGDSLSWFAPALDADLTAFREALSGALGQLPMEQRAVVHLKLWEGRTFEDIASMIDIPLNTAASRYRYGLEKLRHSLRHLYEEIRHLPQP